MFNEVKNYIIKQRYIFAGLFFAEQFLKYDKYKALGLNSSYDSALDFLQQTEKQYVFSGYSDKQKLPYETIDFATLACEHGSSLSKKHLENLLDVHVQKATRHAKTYRNKINGFYAEQDKNVQMIQPTPGYFEKLDKKPNHESQHTKFKLLKNEQK